MPCIGGPADEGPLVRILPWNSKSQEGFGVLSPAIMIEHSLVMGGVVTRMTSRGGFPYTLLLSIFSESIKFRSNIMDEIYTFRGIGRKFGGGVN